MGLAGILLLAAPAPSIEPVFSNDDQGATRDVKVCILLLQATGWENPEPFFLPTLASNAFDRVRNLRPNNWNLVNPLAPSVVTPAMAQLWDKQTGSGTGGAAVIFDGVSGQVDNDFEDNGNDTAAEVNVNQGHYNGSAGNPYGPNSYRAHCQPTHLSQYGTNGTSTTLALPAVGQPVPKTHPAYWEVPLTPVTVSQLANFDAVFVNTHRNLRFTQEEQVLLRQFLDQGGTLYLEDSHGCRLEVRAGGDETLPEDVDFFLPFQFVDGFPGSPDGNGERWDLYPVNRGGVNTLTPSKTVVNAGHPLLNALHTITAAEADRIGDVRARDHLLVRSSPTIYLLDEVLRTTNSDQRWGNPTGNGNEPALAVARVGSGKLILSGMDAIDDCSKPYETGNEPDSNILPDIKFMFNLLAWKGGSGGDRRGGSNNQGVTASQAVRTVLPRFVWHEPESWSGSATQFANIAAESPDPTALQTDPNFMLKEPLAVANGVVYLQYQSGGNYYLTAVDAEPSSDLDGDGQPDDGPIRDMTQFGATSDTLWRADVGTRPLVGATVVSVTHEAKNVPVDVLVASQVAGTTAIRLLAFHATVDAAQNAATPSDTPGGAFYNWTSTAATWGPATDGYVDLSCQGELDASAVGAPVVYNNLVYVASSTDFGMILSGEDVPAGEYVKVFAVRLVPDPGAGIDAGTVAWSYPDSTTYPEEGAPQVPLSINPGDPLHMIRFNAMKQVDGTQAIGYRGGFPGPNFINGASASSQERHDAPADGSWQSSIVRAMRDPLHLRPTVGLARDSRTGLVTQTVFLTRANGDLSQTLFELENPIRTTADQFLELGRSMQDTIDRMGQILGTGALSLLDQLQAAVNTRTAIAGARVGLAGTIQDQQVQGFS
ncbi:MAG: hypothetical protein HUU35_06755, partial [Armatimonadetes bacterium]|nr:hypothetical protein [Armatimonadota bacterium]